MSKIGTQPPLRRKRFIPKYEVEGVYKVTIDEETQTHTETVVGPHVNAQYPWKFISKAKIMESIDMCGELSSFYSIREQLEAYSEEEVLIGYIFDETTNTDDFYVCCTIEARDHCKQQSDKFIRRQEKKLEKSVNKIPKPWKGLGSDAEIIELKPVNQRELIEVDIKTKFPMQYEPGKFDIRDTYSVRDGYLELLPHRDYNNIYRRRVDCGSQITPVLADRDAQTHLTYPKNKWTQSIADALGQIEDTEGGGDASQVSPEKEDDGDKSSVDDDNVYSQPVDEEGLATFKAALTRMRRPSYLKMINSYVKTRQSEMESIIKLNAVTDLYHNDYSNLANHVHSDSLATMTFEEYVCFTDVRAKNKFVSCAAFHPMWSGIVAISYADSTRTVMKTHSTTDPDRIQRAVYGLNPVLIWSHIDSLIPKLYLDAPREVKVLSFCPFNENLLVGGLVSGQVVMWDLTSKLENVEKIEILSETREKYRIAMNAHMGWMKYVDDRKVVNATVCSGLMNCHLNSVSAIKWMSPNFTVTPTGKTIPTPDNQSSLQFISASVNGSILVWNMSVDNIGFVEDKKVKKSTRVARKPSGLLSDVSPFKILDRILQPCYKIILSEAGQVGVHSIQSFGMTPPKVQYIYTPKSNSTGRKYFTCKILKENEEDLNSIFYFGSQHGSVTQATWEGHEFNTGESVNSEYADIKFRCKIHDGIIVTTIKNPLIYSITLTVGGKIFAIWSDKLLGRPIIWKKRPYRLTDGAWSQYKPSVLFITNDEGGLETWDLLLRSDKPISVQTLSGNMLTGLSLHTLPLTKNIMGVSDVNGSFRMFLKPPIFMLENPNYKARMEAMIERELKVMHSFISWQDNFIKKYPHVLEEIKRKEGMLLAEKEEEKRKQREELGKKHEEEAEARRLEKTKYVGPEERWQKIIQKLIEKTIAVKKRINRALLIEHEKPLRELEAQRIEKERRMMEIMKNQKAIFNDTVAILFPEAVRKPAKPKKSLLSDNKEALKKQYLDEYKHTKKVALKRVKKNPYQVEFGWNITLAEGKERRAALNAYENIVKMHFSRTREESGGDLASTTAPKVLKKQVEVEDDEESVDLT